MRCCSPSHRRANLPLMAREYTLDGTRITSLEAFYDEISDNVIPGVFWGRNLDAFNDILWGGFGTPPEGFTIRWQASDISRKNLGHAETEKLLELILERCHPSGREKLQRQLTDARNGKGPTVFDWLVEIVQDHADGGENGEGKVRLVLE